VLHALDDIRYPQDLAINRAADLIDQVRLSHRMMHIARDLSGGEKQRVVLARQLAKNPSMLFADEPTGTLDPETARLVHGTLIEAAKKNTMGMVVTSHFSQVIEDMANRAMLLVDGEIATIGSPKSVIRAFAKDYHEIEESEPVELGGKILAARDKSGQFSYFRCCQERDLWHHREEWRRKDHALPNHCRYHRAHGRRDEHPDRR
jgi:methyl coenzyme M reductase system subunit A2